MVDGFSVETGPSGEIEIPAELVKDSDASFAHLTPDEVLEREAESQSIIDATRPQPGDSDIRIGSNGAHEQSPIPRHFNPY